MIKFRKKYLALLVCFIAFSPPPNQAQTSVLEKKYSFSFQNLPLESVIDTLRKNADCGFSYNADIIVNTQNISFVFKNKPLSTILDSILLLNNLLYKQVGNNIVIVKRVSNNDLTFNNYSYPNDTVSYIQFAGQIINHANKEPVSYAYVFLKSQPIGTLSNAEGRFIIKLPYNCYNDSIYFSCIGYRMEGHQIAHLQSVNYIITLSPVDVQIREVIVRPIKPEELLKEALDAIPHNYSPNTQMLTGFYRETIQQNGNYVVLSEAILHIYKAKYNGYSNDRVKIFKARKSPFIHKMDTVVVKFQGGIYNSLSLDIAKNPSNFISVDYFNFYDFKLDEIATIEGRSTYIISFDQKDYLPYALYKGKVYIDRQTLAFVRADFMLSPKGIDNATSMLVRKSPLGFKVKPITATYLVNYTFRNGGWYLNHIREELKIKVHKRFNIHSLIFKSVAEMVITQTDTINIKQISRNETVRETDIFTEKIGPYDEAFWSKYNFIKPDELLEDALKRIGKNGKKVNSN